MARTIARTLALACSLAVAACSAAGGTLTPEHGTPALRKIAASVTIRIPHKHAPKGRRGRYVSPSTESIEIDVNPAPSCTACSPAFKLVGDLLPQSIGCNAQDVCTLPFAAFPGTYGIAISTFDGLVSGGVATGNVLTHDQNVVFAIASGKANLLQLTLDGVPAYVGVGIAGGSSANAVQGWTGALRMIGRGTTAAFTFTVYDADGNAIVGPGTPTYAVGGGSPFAVAQTGPQSFTVTSPTAYTAASGTITLASQSPGCSISYSACNKTVAVSFDQLLAVEEATLGVVVWPVGAPASAAQYPSFSGVTAGNTPPAFDSKWDLFVEDSSGTHLEEFAPPYTAPPTIFPIAGYPTTFGFDKNDDLIVPETTNPQIDVIAPPYTGVPTYVTTGIANPNAIAFDSAWNLWVSNGSNVVRYAPPYAGTSPALTISSGISQGFVLTTDGAGNVYVINQNYGSYNITKYPPQNGASPSVTYVNTGAAPLSYPSAFGISPIDGTLLVNANTYLNRYPSNAATAISSAGEPLNYLNMVVDADGTAWLNVYNGVVAGANYPYAAANIFGTQIATNAYRIALSP